MLIIYYICGGVVPLEMTRKDIQFIAICVGAGALAAGLSRFTYRFWSSFDFLSLKVTIRPPVTTAMINH